MARRLWVHVPERDHVLVLEHLRRDVEQVVDRDEADELAEAEQRSPAERVADGLELSDLARALGEAAEATWIEGSPEELGEKAGLYALPLKLLLGR
jgi:hypothetical protein